MKKVRKMLAILLAGTMLFGLAACGDSNAGASTGESNVAENDERNNGTGSEGAQTESTGEKAKIVILSFDVTGDLYKASTAYLDALKEELNFEYEYVSAGYSSQEQIQTVETYLAQGYKGVIINQDGGSLEAILDLAEDYDAYVGGYWQNFNSSLYAASDGGTGILNNERFLGSSVDGKNSCEALVNTMFETAVLKDGHTKIGIVTMPTAWYPNQVYTGVDVFVGLVEEYNKGDMAETNGVPVELVENGTDENGNTIYYEQVDGESMSLSSSFFTENEMEACISLAATSFSYAAITEAKADLDLYTVGWESMYKEVFGSNGMIKSVSVSPVDTLIYPLVQVLDAINGNFYADKPAAEDKIVETDGMDIIGDEGMAEFEKTLNCSLNAEDAYFTPEQVKNFMVTYNPDATYADLLAAISSDNMTINATKTRN